MVIFVTGADGYIGWPCALSIAQRTDSRVVAIDNFGRRQWVDNMGGVSATPITSMDRRIETATSEHGICNLSFVETDLTDRSAVNELLTVHQPKAVVHMAAQPSAPYSQINGERANYTQYNNMQATRNLLWGLDEHELTDTHFIETTTTGVYGAPEFPIPEGGGIMEHDGHRDEVPFPALGGSWYHATKCYDAHNMRLAHSQFDIPISDVRTAITYGASTPQTAANDRLATRFDFDYYFGTVAHRFCAQAIAGYPITVYGKGEQRKPFIGLEDVVEGLSRLACNDPTDRPGDHTVYNQVTRAISIVEVAETIADVADRHGYDVPVKHVENPRDEDESHKMEIENERYLDLIGEQRQTFEEGMEDVFETIVPYEDRIVAHEDRFLPDALE